jgi:hypothetical protein
MSLTVLCLSKVGAFILDNLVAKALAAVDWELVGACFAEEIECRRRSGEIGCEVSICMELLASGWNFAVFLSNFDSSSEEV